MDKFKTIQTALEDNGFRQYLIDKGLAGVGVPINVSAGNVNVLYEAYVAYSVISKPIVNDGNLSI